MAAPIPFCDNEYADTFLGAHRWIENWTGADSEEKTAALVNATQVILQFCRFPQTEEEATTLQGVVPLPPTSEVEYIDYTPTSTDDENIPDWLRQACCYEALYFLDLENDPARPFPLGILGIIKDDKTTFDHNYEPPLFSQMCRSILGANGAEIDDPFYNGNEWGERKWL